MLSYQDRYFKFQEELWNKFEELVKHGATFRELVDVDYPEGINPKGLPETTEIRGHFLAFELIADPDYKLKPEVGPKDLIVDFNPVSFIDTNGIRHHLEPEVTDLYWVCCVLDGVKK